MLQISETLTKAYNGIKNVDTIINGHTPAQTTWADLKEYADFNKDLVDLDAGRAEGRQDAGAGGRRVEAAGEIQGLLVGRADRCSAASPGGSRRCRRKRASSVGRRRRPCQRAPMFEASAAAIVASASAIRMYPAFRFRAVASFTALTYAECVG